MLTTPGGTGGPDTVRRLNVPQPQRVEAGSDGTPRRVYHRGRWRLVVQVRERYRTNDRWWTDAPVSRDYFELLLDDGRPITIYRDRLEGHWYSH